MQSWSNDDTKLRHLRSRALLSVKDSVISSKYGALITGREHYFSSEFEMLSALGVGDNFLVLRVRDEFSFDEMMAYFGAREIDVILPEWLPRRPLICQTIAQLEDDDRDNMFGSGRNEASFCNLFINVICKRDARINQLFDENTIYEVFVSLSGVTRSKSANVGPISQRELQEAFESVVGTLPVEEASVMLQRLPSLGRVSSDSGDRQFIDMYILDGLRAHHVDRIVRMEHEERQRLCGMRWANPLQALGQKVLATMAEGKAGAFEDLATRASRGGNGTLAGDIVCGLLHVEGDSVNYHGIEIIDAAISDLDFSKKTVRNLSIRNSVIETVEIPGSPPLNVGISGNIIGRVFGVSSADGLGSWIQDNEIEDFDSVRTVDRIRDVGLSPGHEVLVTIIKKTFFQPGKGRMEDALMRGFAAGSYNKVAPKVLNLLMHRSILTTHRGREGLVYKPNRSEAGRMKQLLDELKSSSDPLWKAVEDL